MWKTRQHDSAPARGGGLRPSAAVTVVPLQAPALKLAAFCRQVRASSFLSAPRSAAAAARTLESFVAILRPAVAHGSDCPAEAAAADEAHLVKTLSSAAFRRICG